MVDLQSFAEGCVHGRFQPFHNGHLEYVLAAQSRCAFLWVGITKYDIDVSELSPLGRHSRLRKNSVRSVL